MHNIFMLNEAIPNVYSTFLIDGFSELINIKSIANITDNFLKHHSIYNYNFYLEICSNYSHINQTILTFIEQLKNVEYYLYPSDSFNETYPDDCNAYLGIVFNNLSVGDIHQIKNQEDYYNFHKICLWDINATNFWEKREELFPHLIFCEEVEIQICHLGADKHFKQIIKKLMELDKAVAKWVDGAFDYKKLNEEYPLNISPESDQTMSTYKNERRFRLPNGGKEIFDLHLKTGDLRFYIFPDNDAHNLYVGYIGPHLKTVRF